MTAWCTSHCSCGLGELPCTVMTAGARIFYGVLQGVFTVLRLSGLPCMLELVSLGPAPHQLHAAALDSVPAGPLPHPHPTTTLFSVVTASLTLVLLARPQDRTEGFVAWLIPRARAVCKLTLTATRDEEAVAAMGLAGGSQLGPLVLQASRVGPCSRSSCLPKSPMLPVHALAGCAAAPAELEVSHPACLT